MSQRMLRRLSWPGRLTMTTRLDEAIDGASFVLVQLRVGGQAARLVDETLPLRFGTIGQETTGAGGFAKALRTVPIVLDIAERVAMRAARGHGSWTSRIRSASSPRRSSMPVIARSASATWGSGRSGGSRRCSGSRRMTWCWSTSASTTSAGPGRSVSTASTASTRSSTGSVTRSRTTSVCRWRRCAGSTRCPRPTSATTTGSRASSPSSDPPRRERRRSWTSSAVCSSSTATRRSTPGRSCSTVGAARTTRSPLPGCSRRSTTAPATSRSSTSATTGRSPDFRTMPWSRCRRGSTVTARIRVPLAPLDPSMLELVTSVKTFERLTIRRHVGRPIHALAALEANPLVGSRTMPRRFSMRCSRRIDPAAAVLLRMTIPPARSPWLAARAGVRFPS